MRKYRIVGITRRRRRGLTRQAMRAVFAADLIGRDFTAPRPGMRMVGDTTELVTLEEKLYLATCIDLATGGDRLGDGRPPPCRAAGRRPADGGRMRWSGGRLHHAHRPAASLRSRRSSSRSAVVSSPGAPCPQSGSSCLTQFRRPSALTPSCRATSVTVFPEERTRATASRLNSSVYRLLRLLLLPTWHYFLWNSRPSLQVSKIKGKVHLVHRESCRIGQASAQTGVLVVQSDPGVPALGPPSGVARPTALCAVARDGADLMGRTAGEERP